MQFEEGYIILVTLFINRNEIFLPKTLIYYTNEKIKPVIVTKRKTPVSINATLNNHNHHDMVNI